MLKLSVRFPGGRLLALQSAGDLIYRGPGLTARRKHARLQADCRYRTGQRRWSRSKSRVTRSPSGGSTSTVAEPEAKASTEKSNWRVAPVRMQPPSSEQPKLGWPEEEKGLSIWSSLET